MNFSKVTSNATVNSEHLVRWRCSAKIQPVTSSNEAFVANFYLVSFVNVVGAIFALLSNSLFIYAAYKNKRLNKITRVVSILLALIGLVGSLVIQPLFATAHFIGLTNIYSGGKSHYCILISIAVHGTKLLAAFSIIAMLCITSERLTAVVHPYHYRTNRKLFLKALPCALVVSVIHFALIEIWPGYENHSKRVTAIFTIVPYIFTIYAYVRIYVELRKRGRAVGSASKHSITLILVVVTYLICYLPMVIVRSFNLDKNYLLVKLYVIPWCSTLLFCAFTLNPVAYGWSSMKTLKFCVKTSRTVDGIV